MREGFEQTGNIFQSSTGYLQVAAGTTAQRPTANNGMLRYNIDYQAIEQYTSNAWSNVGNLTQSTASALYLQLSGGTLTGSLNLSSSNLNITSGSISMTGGNFNMTNGNLSVTNGNITTVAGTFIAPVGSTTSPSHTFSGDTSTGLYRPSASNVGVSAGGVNVASFSNTQILHNVFTNFTNTDAFSPPSGNTAQRPTTLSDGLFRWNTTQQNLEVYSANAPAKWGAIAPDTWTHPGFANGTVAQYYGSILDIGTTQLVTNNYTSGTIYYVPIYVGAGMTFDRVGVYVNTSAVGNIRLGLYSNSYPLGLPSTLLNDFGNIATVAGGGGAGAKEYTITAISPNIGTIYWIAFQTSANMSFYSMQFFAGCATPTLGRSSLSSGGTGILGYTQTATFGAFASTVGTLAANTGQAPFLWFRNV